MSSRVKEVNGENLQDPQSKILATPMLSYCRRFKLSCISHCSIIKNAANTCGARNKCTFDVAIKPITTFAIRL